MVILAIRGWNIPLWGIRFWVDLILQSFLTPTPQKNKCSAISKIKKACWIKSCEGIQWYFLNQAEVKCLLCLLGCKYSARNWRLYFALPKNKTKWTHWSAGSRWYRAGSINSCYFWVKLLWCFWQSWLGSLFVEQIDKLCTEWIMSDSNIKDPTWNVPSMWRCTL